MVGLCDFGWGMVSRSHCFLQIWWTPFPSLFLPSPALFLSDSSYDKVILLRAIYGKNCEHFENTPNQFQVVGPVVVGPRSNCLLYHTSYITILLGRSRYWDPVPQPEPKIFILFFVLTLNIPVFPAKAFGHGCFSARHCCRQALPPTAMPPEGYAQYGAYQPFWGPSGRLWGLFCHMGLFSKNYESHLFMFNWHGCVATFDWFYSVIFFAVWTAVIKSWFAMCLSMCQCFCQFLK